MDTPETNDKSSSVLFYIFIGQTILGFLAVVGYIIYSLIT